MNTINCFINKFLCYFNPDQFALDANNQIVLKSAPTGAITDVTTTTDNTCADGGIGPDYAIKSITKTTGPGTINFKINGAPEHTAWSETFFINDYFVGMLGTLFPSPTWDYSPGYHPAGIPSTQSTHVLTNTNACRPVLASIYTTGADINLTTVANIPADFTMAFAAEYSLDGGATWQCMFFGPGASDGYMTNLNLTAGDELNLRSEPMFFSVVIPAGASQTVMFRKNIHLVSSNPAVAGTNLFLESAPGKVYVQYTTI